MAAEVRAREADIPMGMTQAEEGDHKVLLVRDATGLRAFQAECPHAGAPLAEGHICGRTLYCPWHKAAFDLGDGALVEPPALDGLSQYPIRTEGETIVATLEPMPASRASTRQDPRSFVIVGTGAAGAAAVVTLRGEGFGGKIVMVGREPAQPYDRTMLSKDFLAEPMKPAETLLDPDFYKAHGVTYVMGPATRIEPATRTVTLQNASTIVADALLVATGSRAVVPSFAGGELGGIFALRSLTDAEALSAAATPGKRIAIVGAGFIGLEAAAFLTQRGLAATVIAPEPLPLAARFGDEVGHAVKVALEGIGVQIRQGKIARFEGGSSVEGVRLEGGEVVATDLVLIGAGAAPETAVIDAPKRPDGGIEVDATLRLADGVWLAGDIAAFPERNSGTIARIEHWRLAEQHGRHAALGMLGRAGPFAAAPFFWSRQGETSLEYAGYAPEWDRIVTHGDIGRLDFIAYYVRGNKALAACAVGQNERLTEFLHALGEGRVPSADALAG